MEKQKILSISNTDDYICYVLEKDSSFYKFLSSLLDYFGIDIPDFYEPSGELEDASRELDTQIYYVGKNIKILEVIGYKKIFLFFFTKERKKLKKFMEENCEFIKCR